MNKMTVNSKAFNHFIKSLFTAIVGNQSYYYPIIHSTKKKKDKSLDVKKEFKIKIIFKVCLLTSFLGLFEIIWYLNNNPSYKMKHAILLLSSYGIDYLNNFLSQFNNDKRFDIFIHYNNITKIDIEKGKEITKSNIKYLNYKYESARFSIGMVEVMYLLLYQAYKNYNYDYYHFFSESCYFIKSLDEFYNFFQVNNKKNYVTNVLFDTFYYKNKKNKLYKGSQWMSIHKKLVKAILKKKYLFYKYKKEIKKGKIIIWDGSFDEFIIQHIISHDLCNGKNKKYKLITNNLRYIRWNNCSTIYCPNFLNIDNVSEKEIQFIKENFFIIRKINYKDKKAIQLINKLKDLS